MVFGSLLIDIGDFLSGWLSDQMMMKQFEEAKARGGQGQQDCQDGLRVKGTGGWTVVDRKSGGYIVLGQVNSSLPTIPTGSSSVRIPKKRYAANGPVAQGI
jgi:hypothetical protein